MRLLVRGSVQGIGFRPAIARIAQKLSLAGVVRNTSAGVEIIVEGVPLAINRFLKGLNESPPPFATIVNIEAKECSPVGYHSFEIEASSISHPLQTALPVDLNVCADCLAEVMSLADRRAGYPFTSCAYCGPRYSILHSLPYERSATAMAAFLMCQSCLDEYRDLADRRFHAETVACTECGPRLWIADSTSRKVAAGREAIAQARAALAQGKIVAMRGIGGYQLLADATNGAAIARLRIEKHRRAKPLAVMVASLDSARQLATTSPEAEQVLTAPTGPIVVLPARCNTPLATAVYPGLAEVGLMVPTSPLHWLLARDRPPLVVTSGNLEGRPLAFQIDSAQNELQFVDFYLHHDRPIQRPIDDSVVKMIAGYPVTLRAGRGIAPLTLKLGASVVKETDCVLAVGGQQNNALAMWNGYQAALGPHVGDLDELATCDRWHHSRRDFCQLLDAQPTLVAHDLHPDYYPTRWARESGIPAIAVQHHHAHVAAAMVDQKWLDREVLGVAWDGTGYGPDGTIWGGEFLRATVTGFQRIARLRPFPLLGGEMSIREPWRVALTLLAEAIGTDAAIKFMTDRGWQRDALARMMTIVSREHLWPLTSSMGRLFDAVAVLTLPFEQTQGGNSFYEGHLPMLLESACQWLGEDEASADEALPYPFPLVSGEPAELDWRPLLAVVVADRRDGQTAAVIARRFHAALANAIAEVSDSCRDLPIALCGGVFQNRVLTEMCVRRFVDRSQPLGTPGTIPPGDGGLAAGQLVVALAQAGSISFQR